MAIKGKSRSRGAKAVTRGPKPAYVPVRTPLLRRRGLWISLAVIVGVAAVAGIAIGLVQERNRNREEDLRARMAAVVGRYRQQIDPILATFGQPLPPTGFDAYPSLAQAIDGIAADEVDPETLKSAESEATTTASSAKSASELLSGISPTELVADKGFSREFVLYVIGSQGGFVRAADLYREAARLLTMAVEADEGEARDDLVAVASGVHDVAEETFADAYSDYVEAQIAAGAFVPSSGTLPGVTGAAGP